MKIAILKHWGYNENYVNLLNRLIPNISIKLINSNGEFNNNNEEFKKSEDFNSNDFIKSTNGNIGNLTYEISLFIFLKKHFNLTCIYIVDIISLKSCKNFIKPDYLILTPANTLHNKCLKFMKYLYELKNLINCKTIIASFGSQNMTELNNEYLGIIKKLCDQNTLTLVRDKNSYNLLKNHIPNLYSSGCPAIFLDYKNRINDIINNSIRVKNLITENRKINILIYPSPISLININNKLIEIINLFNYSNINFIIMSEINDFKLILNEDFKTNHTEFEKILLKNDSLLTFDLDKHIEYIYDKNIDICFSTRLHGTSIAINCGIPTINLSIDNRTKYCLEKWKIPESYYLDLIDKNKILSLLNQYDSTFIDNVNDIEKSFIDYISLHQ